MAAPPATARKGPAQPKVPFALNASVANRSGMTVEDLLRATLDGLVDRVQSNTDEAIRRLREAFEEEKAAILDGVSHKRRARMAAKEATKNLMLDVTLEAVEGPYVGKSWTVQPRAGSAPKKLGRSTGKTFVSSGVSLPEDTEVSTTHGKFEVKDGKVFYTDSNSTNGSIVNGDELTPRRAHELKTGDTLAVGGTTFNVAVMVVT